VIKVDVSNKSSTIPLFQTILWQDIGTLR